MAGINRATGKLLDGWPHVVQSLQVLFTTSYGQRVMRRYFGSDVPRLLGENITRATVLRFCSAVVVAIDLWEPRFRVTKIDFDRALDTPETLRAGRLAMTLRGVYRPRGHLGDVTPDRGTHALIVGLGSEGIEVT